MSTNINTNILKQFILKTVGNDLTSKEAQKLGFEQEFSRATEELDVNTLDLDDIVQDNDLYEQFATLYTTEKEQKVQAKDKEQEKEEQRTVKDKNNAGV